MSVKSGYKQTTSRKGIYSVQEMTVEGMIFDY